jgi:hypothetical protein
MPHFFVPVFGTICLLSLPCSLASVQADPPGQEKEPTTVIHVETREAVIDVVARDRLNLPIADLTANEFEVYEIPEHGSKMPRRILSLSTIDPEHKTREDSTSGFRVSSARFAR